MPIPAGILGAVALGLAVRVLVGLGVSVLVYSGITTVVDYGSSAIWGLVGGLPATLYDILGLMGVWDGLAIILAAYSAYITVRAAFGAFKKVAFAPFGS